MIYNKLRKLETTGTSIAKQTSKKLSGNTRNRQTKMKIKSLLIAGIVGFSFTTMNLMAAERPERPDFWKKIEPNPSQIRPQIYMCAIAPLHVLV